MFDSDVAGTGELHSGQLVPLISGVKLIDSAADGPLRAKFRVSDFGGRLRGLLTDGNILSPEQSKGARWNDPVQFTLICYDVSYEEAPKRMITMGDAARSAGRSQLLILMVIGARA